MHDLQAYLHFRDRFAEAIDPGWYPVDHLDRLIASGQGVIFHHPDAAIVVEIKIFPGGKCVLHGLVAAGDLPRIQALIRVAEQWGRSNGCTAALIESRPGWERVMRGEGYRPHQLSIVKDL